MPARRQGDHRHGQHQARHPRGCGGRLHVRRWASDGGCGAGRPRPCGADLVDGRTGGSCPAIGRPLAMCTTSPKRSVPRLVEIEADRHDALMAALSHVPQVVASALMARVGATAGEDSLAHARAGLRDTTRLASGSAEMWASVLATNARSGPTAVAAADFQRIAGPLHDAQAVRDCSWTQIAGVRIWTSRSRSDPFFVALFHPAVGTGAAALAQEVDVIRGVFGRLLAIGVRAQERRDVLRPARRARRRRAVGARRRCGSCRTRGDTCRTRRGSSALHVRARPSGTASPTPRRARSATRAGQALSKNGAGSVTRSPITATPVSSS